MAADLRIALRTLGRVPAFTAIAVLSIALGIGANTAIFSLLDQVVLRPLPVSDPASLVFLKMPETLPGSSNSDYPATVFSYPMYKDLQDRSQAIFEDLIGRSSTSVALQYTDSTERGRAEMVSGNFFQMLGVRPAHGRLLTPDDDRAPGAHPVVVLSHSYWTRQFAASAAVLNQTVRLNGHPMTIVGVAPPRFVGTVASQIPDVFVPLMMKKIVTPSWDGLFDNSTAWLTVFGRLRPGVTAERAETALEPIFRPMMQEFLTARNQPKGAAVRPAPVDEAGP